MADKHTTAVPTSLAAKPLKTFRPAQAGDTYAYPAPEIARLTELGLLHRLTDGYYVVVPRSWLGDAGCPASK